MRRTVNLVLPVTIDDNTTDAESIASALDNVLSLAFTKYGSDLLEDYGTPEVGRFAVAADPGTDECATCPGWAIFNAGGESLGDIERCDACGSRKGIDSDTEARAHARTLGFKVDGDFNVYELPPGVDVDSDPATWIEQARAALGVNIAGTPPTGIYPCGHRRADDAPSDDDCPTCERLAAAADDAPIYPAPHGRQCECLDCTGREPRSDE